LHAQLLLPLRCLEGRLLQSIRHATHVWLRHVSHVACVNGLLILGEVRERNTPARVDFKPEVRYESATPKTPGRPQSPQTAATVTPCVHYHEGAEYELTGGRVLTHTPEREVSRKRSH
jgi:hypothetical protein